MNGERVNAEELQNFINNKENQIILQGIAIKVLDYLRYMIDGLIEENHKLSEIANTTRLKNDLTYILMTTILSDCPGRFVNSILDDNQSKQRYFSGMLETMMSIFLQIKEQS